MRVSINLASQPYQDARQFWLRWGGGVGALTVFTLVLVYWAAAGLVVAGKDRSLIRQREDQIAQREAQKQKAQVTLNLPQNRSTRDRSQFLNDLFQRKSFCWTRVFEDLEKVMPAQLHVVSIQPAMSAGNQLEIKLMVAGESRERALELVRKMESSQRFRQTEIEQESVQTGQNAGDNVQFTISAVYVPALPGTDQVEEEAEARP
ncbi:MAG TPA: PilN domain-containing protein [Terriglobales bacterium]|nr:PilN domain-containing protein [Terriglobales bacterium]